MGDATSEPKSQIDALINDARGLTIDGKDPMTDAERANQVNKKDQSQEIVVQAPLNRVTAADERGDTTSLDRLLHRTLFLLMKNEAGRWTFPEDAIQGREGLHDVSLAECIKQKSPADRSRPPNESLCKQAEST